MRLLIIIPFLFSCTTQGKIARAVRVVKENNLSVINLDKLPGKYYDTTVILYTTEK